MPEPLLLDTDIGSDIDDAAALLYLLRHPDCELLGVTTVSGEVRQRAALARALCDAAGANKIPVLAGARGPILFGRGQPEVPQFEAIADRAPPIDYEPGAAIEFLRRAIRARPGEVTLLAIGPMTNLALLFTLDPELPALLKRLVLMCGQFFGWDAQGNWRSGPGSREWNALQDPVATSIVYRAPVREHMSIGIDVTRRCMLRADACRERFAAGDDAARLVLKMAEVWFARSSEYLTFHDPLAAACIFEPTLCEFAQGRVDVDAQPGPLEGLTTFERHRTDDPAAPPHRVAASVEAQRFLDHYFTTIAASR